MVRRFGVRMVAIAVVVSSLLSGLALVALTATPAAADDPLFVDWSSLVPSLSDAYDPLSDNDCTAGRSNCVDITIREMQRRFDGLGQACSHNSVFSLAYLRTTQTYEWARNQPGFFIDTNFVNHEDAVFAKYYFDAFDNWSKGYRDQVPQAWQIALDAAANKQVTGSGNLLLGMSAHVNRDLPFVLYQIGLTFPDGTSRKPDHDKVNQFLNAVIEPLMNEEWARFDPTITNISTPYGVGWTAFFQELEGWREQAWRNAEALADAPTAADRALVAQQIEDSAAATANLLVAQNAYGPLQNSSSRDAYCAVNNGAAAPEAYAFGMPTPW